MVFYLERCPHSWNGWSGKMLNSKGKRLHPVGIVTEPYVSFYLDNIDKTEMVGKQKKINLMGKRLQAAGRYNAQSNN